MSIEYVQMLDHAGDCRCASLGRSCRATTTPHGLSAGFISPAIVLSSPYESSHAAPDPRPTIQPKVVDVKLLGCRVVGSHTSVYEAS